jgi:hypothetical protein
MAAAVLLELAGRGNPALMAWIALVTAVLAAAALMTAVARRARRGRSR